MKKFSKIFVIGLMFLILPILVACYGNNDEGNENNISLYTVSFNIELQQEGEDDVVINAPVKSEENEYYLIQYVGSTYIYFDAHGVDILSGITGNTEITLSFYFLEFSELGQIKINDSIIDDYDESANEGIKKIEFSFKIESNTTISIKGNFYQMD